MAYARKCDACGKLYEEKDSLRQYHPLKDSTPVKVIVLTFKEGREKLDLCPGCVLEHLTEMCESIEEMS